MKLGRMIKISKKVLAIVLALAMTVVGNYFVPEVIDAAQPGYTDAIIDNDFHTIGTDGWQYKFRGNHLVEYKGGTAYNDSLITNITRSENNDHDFQIKTPVATVTPGHTYKMTMRIDNYGSTTQGASCYATVTDPSNESDITSNYNNKVDVPAGSYREIELEFTAPGSGQIYSKVNWGWSALCEFKFTPTLVDTTPTGWTDCVIDNNYHTIGTNGFQYKFRDPSSAKYKDGTGTSIDEPLDIQVTNTVNNDHDFQTISPVVAVTPGNTYRLTYNLANLGTTPAQDCGANIYATVTDVNSGQDITSNYNNKVGLDHNDNIDIVLEFEAPASGQVYFKLNNSWTPITEFILTPTVEDITPTGWNNCIIDGSYHTIGNAGFQYQFRDTTIAKYKGGEDINDPLDIRLVNTINDDHDFITSSPVATVTPGHKYKLTYNIANEGSNDTGDTFYSAVMNASGDVELATNYNSKVGINAGTSKDIELIFLAPESGQVYFKLNSSYTPVSEYVLTPTLTDLTPDAQPITAGQWGYAGANDKGWKYFVRANGSAYMGGTTLDDALTINYGTYVNDTYTCIVRSPITEVDSAKTYTGSMTIKNDSKETLTANNIHVSVHWYNAETGQDGEISAATSVDIAAGESHKFNLSYTAPDSGYIFYEASTNYTPGLSSFTYSATHTPPADGRYDVAQYKSGATPTYPEKEDKIFAGWFDDENYSTPHMGNTGLAYAKFIDEEVLTVKFQTRGSGSNAEAVRFVSTVDSMDYQIVGFKFTGTYGDINISEKIKTTEKLYRSIKAAGMTFYPPYFCSDSEYFFTYTVRGMNSRIYSSWVVTPFYVTLDGTTVYGRTGRFPS